MGNAGDPLQGNQWEMAMELQDAVKRQRIHYIISSYRLNEVDAQSFDTYLETLLVSYPWPLIELALVETLINNWLQVPMKRGDAFLAEAHIQLQSWEQFALLKAESVPCAIASTITPEQFQQITNLDPSPIFGLPDWPQAEDKAASV